MKCLDCTSYQKCGTCNNVVCRQCGQIHGSKCQADRSDDAHLHFQNHDDSQQVVAEGSPEEGKNESKKKSLSKEQDERMKRHKEIAWKRKMGGNKNASHTSAVVQK